MKQSNFSCFFIVDIVAVVIATAVILGLVFGWIDGGGVAGGGGDGLFVCFALFVLNTEKRYVYTDIVPVP